jgi:hypothetical protein
MNISICKFGETGLDQNQIRELSKLLFLTAKFASTNRQRIQNPRARSLTSDLSAVLE